MSEFLPLTRGTLDRLPSGVNRPAYDLSAVRGGILHLGFGGFHRAHMAAYTHDLMMRRPDALAWGIIGTGLMPADRRMQEVLAPQDGLYTLVERQDDDEAITVIGAVCKVLYAGDTSATVLEALDDPAVRIVSLTVTPHGYCLHPATRTLDFDHPAIVHDLANPRTPRSAIGILVEAFRRRRTASTGLFTALSCDNIPHNGRVLKAAVLALGKRLDPDLADWVAENGAFPNTMVDRITPTTTPEQVADLAERIGVRDAWPVFSERFRQWVIEDDFVAGRPTWEEVGVQFVPDVAPYELMKLRLLNASHLAVAGLGRLRGYDLIDETLRDPDIRAYMSALMERETGPTLDPVPGVDLAAYKAELLNRFGNRRIRDTVDRVNTDAPVELLLDPIRDGLDAGRSVELLALALAAWMRRVAGIDEAGRPIDVFHPQADRLRERALAGRADPRALLGLRSIFGDLDTCADFVASLETWLSSLYAVGAQTTLARARQKLEF